MIENKAKLINDLPDYVTDGPKKMQLEAYLVALEGWRRGLKLTFYSRKIKPKGLKILDKTTEGRVFSLENEHGKKHFFYRSRGDLVSGEAVSICQNKEYTKKHLLDKKVSVPMGFEFNIKEETINSVLNKAKKMVGFPLVLKPRSGSMGKGVIVNIKNENELKRHLEDLKRKKGKYIRFIIETYIPGEEYRVYVVGDKVIGATNRIPANVIGDGVQTISQLIDDKNKVRKNIPYLSYKPIKVDSSVKELLNQKGYSLDTVIPKGEQVFLRKVSNLSSGGDPLDETDNLTDEVKQIAVNALNAIPDLHQGGVDVIVDENDPKKGYVIEINATAEIAFHHFPIKGKARHVSKAIVDYYFPETIGKEKTDLYFNYQDAIKPLNNMTANEVSLAQVPPQPTEKYKYIIKGKINKVGYLTMIKRTAADFNVHGYVEKVSKNEIEVNVATFSNEDLLEFERAMKKGTKKSVIDGINREPIDKFLKMGFEIKK